MTLIHRLSADPARLTKQRRGSLVTLIVSVAVTVGLIVLAIAVPGLLVVSIIFGVLSLLCCVIYGAMFFGVSKMLALGDDGLRLFDITDDGLQPDPGALVPWELIARVDFRWIGATADTIKVRGTRSLGSFIAGKLLQRGSIDNAVREVTLRVTDYAAVKALIGAKYDFLLQDRTVDDAAAYTSSFAGSIDDETFRVFLEVLARECAAKGRELRRVTPA
jgi:hypothetical protein